MVTWTWEWEWRETGASDPRRALGTSGIGEGANRVAVAEIAEHSVDDGVFMAGWDFSQPDYLLPEPDEVGDAR